MIGDQNDTFGDLSTSADLSPTLPFLVYHWFQSQFPAWKPEWDPRYQHCSQSLMGAALPEGVPGPAGIVHFKSPENPLWSGDELAALRSAYAWALLILSPQERFSELDSVIDSMSAQSSRLVIWRPDRPTAQEVARLQSTDLANRMGTGRISAQDWGLDPAAKDAHEILTGLYVRRGILLVKGARHIISQELRDSGLQSYMSACLLSLAACAPTPGETSYREAEQLALRWAALLCGQEAEPAQSAIAAENQLLAWAAHHIDTEPGMLLDRLQPLPDPFQTTRFADEVNAYDAALERVDHLFRCLRRHEISFVQAMAQVSRVFNADEGRLLRWKAITEEVHGLGDWKQAFESAFAYVSGSFPTPVDELEKIKASLLEAAAMPQRFLYARERDRFQSDFEQYKRGYIEYYGAVHENTVHIVGNQEKMKARVDSVALRNLELLSDLPGAKTTYLNDARALGKLVQAHQCDLPVHDILATRPRCHCNFNPEGSPLLVQSVDRMNETVCQGIDYFRSLLRGCRMLIIRELEVLGIDEPHSRQIAALLSQGPMIPLKQQSIDILAAVMKRHPGAFRTGCSPPPTSDF